MALFFLSGKGGVGKTHLSTSLCFHLAGKGRRVQLIEFSKFAQYSEYFGLKVGFEPVDLEKNFYLSSWTGLDCLHEYAAKVLKSKKAASLFFKMPLMKKLSEVAPGLKEIAVLGKITSDYRDNDFQTDFDDIVFDCPASGHFLSMLTVPKALGDTVGSGPMQRQCEDILKVLLDHKEVYFGLIEDGARFSEIELQETRLKLNGILKNKKEINILKNYTEAFPKLVDGDWFKSAKSLAEAWAVFEWK